jgi:GNAT superfamily N-acetyltransferase
VNLEGLTPPSPLDADHDLTGFDSGETSLNDWLQRRAARNNRSGASRTYVVGEGRKVVGYYCLAAGALGHEEAPKALRRNMPDPIPVMVLGRLAIDQRYQNIGLGKALLLDATRRTLQVSRITGVVALLVQAISEPAKRFYLGRGFIESPVKPMMLMLVLATAEKVLMSAPEQGG